MRTNRVIMYMHAGSGNHGCEAIVNSVCHMVNEQVTLISYYGNEDQKYSLKDLCDIISERRFEDHRLFHILYYIYRKVTGDRESFIRYRYGNVFKEKELPLAISIGGDNYCYENMLSDLRLANSAFNRRGTKTVLLGCSIEPELLDRSDIMSDLMKYHTIIARESITFEALRNMVSKQREKTENNQALPQILCFPDPAFTLGKRELPMPMGFAEGNTVGINISPMIRDNESKAGIAMESYKALIDHIIENTDMQIALIPHVIWDRNDDRKPLHELYDVFCNTGRVIEIPDGTCEELKGYISCCRFFVGARTHATIAAYSTCVPTLVVGYSVKARGIARDLFGTEENLVLPIQHLKGSEELIESFQWLVAHECEIRTKLQDIMPGYKERALQTGKEVDKLWEEFSQQQKI